MSLGGSLGGSLAGSLGRSLAGGGAGELFETLGVANVYDAWDSLQGIGLVGGEVDTWTGRLGTVLSAPSAITRPTYGADGGNFNGSSVVQTTIVGSRRLVNTAISPVIVAGSKVFQAVVGRWRVVPTPVTLFARPVELLNGGIGQHTYSGLNDGGTNEYHSFQLDSTFDAPAAATDNLDTSPHVVWLYNDASMVIAVDGTTVGTNAAANFSGNIDRIGVSRAAPFSADFSVRYYVVCDAMPSAAQRAAFLAGAMLLK